MENLIDERNNLVTKKFKFGLSKEEESRLEFIRQELDSIDINHIEHLEKLIKDYETFAQDLKVLIKQTSKWARSPSKSRPQKRKIKP